LRKTLKRFELVYISRKKQQKRSHITFMTDVFICAYDSNFSLYGALQMQTLAYLILIGPTRIHDRSIYL